MKRRAFIIAAATLGLGALVTTAALAHGPGNGQGQGQGQGQGYGQMQGHMQGQGQGQGRMGQGMGQGGGENHDFLTSLDKPLKVEDVRAAFAEHLEGHGNDTLMVGKIEDKDNATITAEIVTSDGTVFRSLEIDKATGEPTRMQ